MPEKLQSFPFFTTAKATPHLCPEFDGILRALDFYFQTKPERGCSFKRRHSLCFPGASKATCGGMGTPQPWSLSHNGLRSEAESARRSCETAGHPDVLLRFTLTLTNMENELLGRPSKAPCWLVKGQLTSKEVVSGMLSNESWEPNNSPT